MANSQQRRERVRRRERLALLAKFLSDPEGRAYFYDLLASTHAFSTSFATNAISMAFREGERNVGIRLLADITEASPDAYLLMLKEVNDERRNAEHNAEHNGNGADEPDSFADTSPGYDA